MDYFTKYKRHLDLKLEVHKVHAEYIGRFSIETKNVLTCLYLSDSGKVPSSLLKRMLKMTAPQITRSTQTLAKAGLVYYNQSPEDGRVKFICLTTIGEKLRRTYLNATFNLTEERKGK